MKISKESINILKNFASISPNLRIYPGSELSVLSPSTSIFAKATVPDVFPVDACFYDINSFLELLTFMENQDIEFGPSSLTMSSGGSTFEYRYADPSVIIAPPAGKSIDLDEHFSFVLTAQDLNTLTQAIKISGAEVINLRANGSEFTLGVSHKSGNVNWSKRMGDTNLNFDAILDVQNLRILSDSYKVTLSKRKFLHFKSETAATPQYWLALDPKSTI